MSGNGAGAANRRLAVVLLSAASTPQPASPGRALKVSSA
jgi:hypothetical protein